MHASGPRRRWTSRRERAGPRPTPTSFSAMFTQRMDHGYMNFVRDLRTARVLSIAKAAPQVAEELGPPAAEWLGTRLHAPGSGERCPEFLRHHCVNVLPHSPSGLERISHV